MSWEEDGIVGHLGEHGRQAVIELLWVAAGQVRATATLKKQRVAGNESVLYEERLRARCVAWGVKQFDFDCTNVDRSAALVQREVLVGKAGDLLDVVGFCCLYVQGNALDTQQFGST